MGVDEEDAQEDAAMLMIRADALVRACHSRGNSVFSVSLWPKCRPSLHRGYRQPKLVVHSSDVLRLFKIARSSKVRESWYM